MNLWSSYRDERERLREILMKLTREQMVIIQNSCEPETCARNAFDVVLEAFPDHQEFTATLQSHETKWGTRWIWLFKPSAIDQDSPLRLGYGASAYLDYLGRELLS